MTTADLLLSRSALVSGSTALEHLKSATVSITSEAVSVSISGSDSLILNTGSIQDEPIVSNLVISEENNDIILSTKNKVVLTTQEDIIYE